MAMTEEQIQDIVFGIIVEQLKIERSTLTRETTFVKDLNTDSLDTTEMVMEIEDAFQITIPDKEAEKLKTVGETIDWIKKALEVKEK